MLPQIVNDILKKLREKGVPVGGNDRAEEEQAFPPTFEEELDCALVESETFKMIEVDAEGGKNYFQSLSRWYTTDDDTPLPYSLTQRCPCAFACCPYCCWYFVPG